MGKIQFIFAPPFTQPLVQSKAVVLKLVEPPTERYENELVPAEPRNMLKGEVKVEGVNFWTFLLPLSTA